MRQIPDPGFADDDGAVDAEVSAALTAYDAAPGDRDRALAATVALQDSRVLVPVVAVLGEVEHDERGLAHDKSSDMAAVLMTGRDGRAALLAFTGSGPLRTWDPDARPVPVTLADAAAAAIQDDAAALLVDVAGPVLFAIEGEDLARLAAGERLLRLADGGWGWAGTA